MNPTPETDRKVSVLEITLTKPEKMVRKIIGLNFPENGKDCWHYIRKNGKVLIEKHPRAPMEFAKDLGKAYKKKGQSGEIRVFSYPLGNMHVTIPNHTQYKD